MACSLFGKSFPVSPISTQESITLSANLPLFSYTWLPFFCHISHFYSLHILNFYCYWMVWIDIWIKIMNSFPLVSLFFSELFVHSRNVSYKWIILLVRTSWSKKSAPVMWHACFANFSVEMCLHNNNLKNHLIYQIQKY